MHINQLKPFVDSDSLPCHKVLTVLDQQANQEDDPLIQDQYKGLDLSDTMKSELDNVLSWFPSVFSNKPNNTISIKTTTTTQIWSPAYTIPVHIEAKFEDELDNLLDDGIIEESDRLWCSPPISVKKDMLIFIVVYYRKLNSVTVYDCFYMPSTEEMICQIRSGAISI